MTQVKNLAVIPAKNTPTPEANPASTSQNLKRDDEKVQPLDDRLHRLNELFALQGQYNKLSESLTNLNDFTINKKGSMATLTLSDDDDKEFTIRNSEVIDELVDIVIKKLETKRTCSLQNWFGNPLPCLIPSGRAFIFQY